MTYEYAEGSEQSSIDVFAFRDESAMVSSLVAKNLGHGGREDAIPAATAGTTAGTTAATAAAGTAKIEVHDDDDESDQGVRHVFKSPREYF
jgi:hypothetical protein